MMQNPAPAVVPIPFDPYAQPVKRPWGRRIRDSFKARWAGYILAIVLAVGAYLIGEYAEGQDRFFVERDPTLSYPYVENTVPSWSLALIAGVGPILLIFLAQVLIRRSPRGIYFDRRTKDLHLAFIVLAEVLAVTYMITNILKGWVGRLRPNFFAYCNYKGYRQGLNSGDLTSYLANTIPGQVGSYRFCERRIYDAQYSFPSGHASISFCGLTFLTLFLLHITSRINFTHHAVGKVLRFFIVLVPLFSAVLICASRIVDYQHHVDDTIWGALIGIAGGLLAFHANYGYRRPTTPGVPVTGGEIMMMPPHSQFAPNYPNNVPAAYDREEDIRAERVPTTTEHVGRIKVSSPLVSQPIRL